MVEFIIHALIVIKNIILVCGIVGIILYMFGWRFKLEIGKNEEESECNEDNDDLAKIWNGGIILIKAILVNIGILLIYIIGIKLLLIPIKLVGYKVILFLKNRQR